MNRSRAIAIADRAALVSLKLLAAINLLFLASFLIMIALAMGKARAEVPVCNGADMLAALQKSVPAKLAAITSEAAATPNGNGLLWKVEKAGAKPSFLFGTMHMTDVRMMELREPGRAAFDAADTLLEILRQGSYTVSAVN